MRIDRRLVTALAGIALAATTPGLAIAQDEEPGAGTSIVVTTRILGAVVRDVVGEAADVTVIMDAGADPHTWQPSARDGERILEADLVIENGLGLEEGLLSILGQARSEGIPVFTATDHITVRLVEDDHADHDEDDGDDGHGHDEEGLEEHDDDDPHQHGANDPHFWLDPLAMHAVVEALAPALEDVGIDAGERAAAVAEELESLDEEIDEILAGIPDDERRLVAGHDSLGYFAERYGFTLVGSVIPAESTAGEASARDLAELAEVMREDGIRVIFVDAGTPQPVARAIADEVDGTVVELEVEQLREDGRYPTFMRDIATTIADALGG